VYEESVAEESSFAETNDKKSAAAEAAAQVVESMLS
jgi:hypothetical protein